MTRYVAASLLAAVTVLGVLAVLFLDVNWRWFALPLPDRQPSPIAESPEPLPIAGSPKPPPVAESPEPLPVAESPEPQRKGKRRHRAPAPHRGSTPTPLPIVGKVLDLLIFHRLMSNATTYLEYGMGGSTTLAALTVKGPIYSVESAVEWCNRLKSHPIITARTPPIETVCVKPPYETTDFGRAAEGVESVDGSYLVEAPEQTSLKGKIADLILVDSRFRVAAALYATRYMDENSFLIVHDFWPRLSEYEALLEYFKIAVAPRHMQRQRAVKRDSPELVRSPRGNRTSVLLPVADDRYDGEFEVTYLGKPTFVVLKLSDETLASRTAGEPLPRYKDFLNEESRR